MSVPLPGAELRHKIGLGLGLAAAVVVTGTLVGRVAVYDPTLLLGAGIAILWGGVFLGIFRATVLTHLRSSRLRRMMLAGLAFRVPMVLLHLAVGFWLLGGRVDFIGYFGSATGGITEAFSGNFRKFQLPGDRDIGGWLVTLMFIPIYLIFGPSLLGTFLWSGVIGFMGAVLFVRAYQLEFRTEAPWFLALCIFFYPSFAFWSSLLGKDSWMCLFLGLAAWGLVKFVREPRPRHAVPIGIAVAFVLVIRTPIGAALGVGIVTAVMLSALRWMKRLTGAEAILRPIVFIVVFVVVVGGAYVTIGTALQRYGITSDDQTAVTGIMMLAVDRNAGFATEEENAGANLTPLLNAESSTAEIVAFLPQAVLTFLFRPHIFEAKNALALAAAVDSSVLLVLVLVRLRHLQAAFRCGLRRPLVTLSLIAFALFSAGLSFESNFGAIVRHRAMVMPFLFILLAVPLKDAPDGTASA